MSNTQNDLFLYEECLLLALRDENGTTEPGATLSYALGGAMLSDLLLDGRVEVVKEGKKSFLQLVDDSRTGDALLDECLAKVEKAKRRAQLSTWVQRFTALPRLKHRAAEKLCARGILKLKEDKILLLFTRRVYPELDGRAEKDILDRLHRAIFTRTREVEPRTVVLVALANSTGLLRVNFDKKKLKEQKKRIEQICEGEVIGVAAKEAVAAAQAAAAMAAIMPAVIVTTVTH